MKKLVLALAAVSLPLTAFAGFRASSFKKEVKLGADYWNIAAALDGKGETTWMADPESELPAEWLEIDVPRSTVDKIALMPGWQQTDETFTDHSRPKTIVVSIVSAAGGEEKQISETTLTVPDQKGWVELDLPNAEVGDQFNGGKVRVKVTEVHPGNDFPVLAVSEILVKLAEKESSATLRGSPSSEDADHLALDMFDDNPKTFFAATGPAPQSFTISGGDYGIASLGLQAGPKTHARPKTVEISAGGQKRTAELPDKPEMQWIALPTLTGFTGSLWAPVTVTITDVYPGTTPGGVGLTEVKFRSTNFEG